MQVNRIDNRKMKYPSVFLTVMAVWLIVDTLAVALGESVPTFDLYLATILFTIAIFFIGFWRNRQ